MINGIISWIKIEIITSHWKNLFISNINNESLHMSIRLENKSLLFSFQRDIASSVILLYLQFFFFLFFFFFSIKKDYALCGKNDCQNSCLKTKASFIIRFLFRKWRRIDENDGMLHLSDSSRWNRWFFVNLRINQFESFQTFL